MFLFGTTVQKFCYFLIFVLKAGGEVFKGEVLDNVQMHQKYFVIFTHMTSLFSLRTNHF